MILDIHVHTHEYTEKSNLTFRRMLTVAKEIGLSGVCITDYDTRLMAGNVEDSPVVVIVGMEYACQEGHLLVFGSHSLNRKMLSLEDALDIIDKDDGIAIAAHPFRSDTPYMGVAVRLYHSRLYGIEAFNGGATSDENLKAFQLAQECALPVFGGSDAYNEARLGRFVTEIRASIHDEREFIYAVKKAKTDKKARDSITPAMRKGGYFVGAAENEKWYHDKMSPDVMRSMRDLSRPR